MINTKPAIWFPTVRTHTGTDIFTERLVDGLNQKGIPAEITWLPLRAEYAPWTVAIPKPPKWATLVHVNTWLHSRFLPKNLPIIATLHHSIHDPNLRRYKGWLRAAYHQYWIAPNERRVMHQAIQVTAVSQFVAEISQKTLCNIPIQVIYNGVDTNLFKPSNQKIKTNKPFRLLYVGSWMTRKGVDLLAPIMHELGNDFELHYTGSKEAEKHKIYMHYNMYDSGRLNQKEVIKAMQNADALLFPSRSEGLPLVVIEAMACGLPVIAMEGTAVDEIIEHEKNGLICQKNDINSFVNNIRYLKENINFSIDLSTNAEINIQKNFTIKNMVNSYLELYQKMIY